MHANGTDEVFATCPYCLEQISFLLEALYPNQTYIEDCEVCCRPIQLTVGANESDGSITLESVSRAQD